MKEKIINGHSEKVGNYLRSIIEDGDPVERKEFIEIYKSLSSGRKKSFNANQSRKQLSKEKLVKFY